LLGWYERAVLHVDTTGIVIDRPIFLLGVPRSGTSLLQDILCTHPQLAYITNTMHQFRRSFCAAEDLRKRLRLDFRGERYVGDGVEVRPGSANEGHAFLADWRAIDPFALDYVDVRVEDLSDAEVERVRSTIRKVIWCFGGSATRFFNKNPELMLYLDQLQRLFPGACFVHLVRDPRMCANSMLKLYRRHRVQEARVRKELRRPPTAPFVPYPRVPRLAEYVRTYGADSVHTTARVWNDAVSLLNGARDEVVRLHELRYEDLVEDPRRELGRLLEFCELPDADQIWQAAARIEDRRATHSYGDFELIERICGTAMRQYGYT
jgi:hypothetical protein